MFVSKSTLLCALLVSPLVLSSNTALRGDRRFLADNEPTDASSTGAVPAPPAPGPPPVPPAEPNNAPLPPPPSPPTSLHNGTPPSVHPKPAPKQGGEQTKKLAPGGSGNDNHVSGGGAGWPVSADAPAPPPALVRTNCDLITPKIDLAAEKTCKTALPAFVKTTSDVAWTHQTPLERETSLDAFCQTDCGQTYTETLLARRRGCNPPTSTSEAREGAVAPNFPAAFPGTYPGLRLGCIIDPMDGQYCAMKKASPGDGECEFYMSCCYGELAITADGNTPEKTFYDMIDESCPGSAVYRGLTCVRS